MTLPIINSVLNQFQANFKSFNTELKVLTGVEYAHQRLLQSLKANLDNATTWYDDFIKTHLQLLQMGNCVSVPFLPVGKAVRVRMVDGNLASQRALGSMEGVPSWVRFDSMLSSLNKSSSDYKVNHEKFKRCLDEAAGITEIQKQLVVYYFNLTMAQVKLDSVSQSVVLPCIPGKVVSFDSTTSGYRVAQENTGYLNWTIADAIVSFKWVAGFFSTSSLKLDFTFEFSLPFDSQTENEHSITYRKLSNCFTREFMPKNLDQLSEYEPWFDGYVTLGSIHSFSISSWKQAIIDKLKSWSPASLARAGDWQERINNLMFYDAGRQQYWALHAKRNWVKQNTLESLVHHTQYQVYLFDGFHLQFKLHQDVPVFVSFFEEKLSELSNINSVTALRSALMELQSSCQSYQQPFVWTSKRFEYASLFVRQLCERDVLSFFTEFDSTPLITNGDVEAVLSPGFVSSTEGFEDIVFTDDEDWMSGLIDATVVRFDEGVSNPAFQTQAGVGEEQDLFSFYFSHAGSSPAFGSSDSMAMMAFAAGSLAADAVFGLDNFRGNNCYANAAIQLLRVMRVGQLGTFFQYLNRIKDDQVVGLTLPQDSGQSQFSQFRHVTLDAFKALLQPRLSLTVVQRSQYLDHILNSAVKHLKDGDTFFGRSHQGDPAEFINRMLVTSFLPNSAQFIKDNGFDQTLVHQFGARIESQTVKVIVPGEASVQSCKQSIEYHFTCRPADQNHLQSTTTLAVDDRLKEINGLTVLHGKPVNSYSQEIIRKTTTPTASTKLRVIKRLTSQSLSDSVARSNEKMYFQDINLVKAVVFHSGSCSFGHYNIIVKRADGRYIFLNDSQSSVMESEKGVEYINAHESNIKMVLECDAALITEACYFSASISPAPPVSSSSEQGSLQAAGLQGPGASVLFKPFPSVGFKSEGILQDESAGNSPVSGYKKITLGSQCYYVTPNGLVRQESRLLKQSFKESGILGLKRKENSGAQDEVGSDNVSAKRPRIPSS